jgi:hypothetical protein
MADETLHHEDIEYEREDLGAGGVLAFLAGLAIVGVLIHLVLLGMYKYLDQYDKVHQTPQNPWIKPAKADTRQASPQEANKFPEPRLEVNERSQLNDERLLEGEKLNSYGWVDQKAGIAHIPIDRAMELIAQRGLPTAPQQSKSQVQTGIVPSARAKKPAPKRADQ